MADITQTLGFDASQALQALQALDSSLTSFEQKLNASAAALNNFNTSGKGIAAQFDKIATSATSAVTAINNFNAAAAAAASAAAPQTPANISALLATLAQAQQAIGGLSAAAGQAQTAIQKLAQSSVQNMTQATKAGDRLAVSFNTIVRVVTTQLIVRAMSTIRTSLEDALKTARDFEISLAQIQTISGPVGGSVQSLAIQIRGLSDEFAQPIEEVAHGFYDILQNQIGGSAEAAVVLRESLTLARIAVSSTADAANALSSVLNSYNLNAASAADISGKLFEAQFRGRFVLSDIANSIGRVTTLAAEMGVSFEEVLASLATLTLNGVKADEAMTLLSNAMRGLIKPTKDMKAAFGELNVANAEVGIATFGFQGFLEKLRDTTNGTATDIAKLTQNIRVGRGVFGLTGNAAEKFSKNLEAIRAAGGETAQSASQLIVQTNAQQVQKELNQLKNFFINDFGLNALKVIKDILQTFGGLVNIVKSLRDAFLWVGATIIAFNALSVAITATRIAIALANGHALLAARSFAALGASMLSIPGAAILVGVTAGILALTRANADAAKTTTDLSTAIDEELNKFREAENAKAATLLIEEKKKQAARTETATLGFQQQQTLVGQLQGLYKQDRDNAIAAQKEIHQSIKDQLKERLSLIERVINVLEQKQQRADQLAKRNAEESFTLRLNAEEKFFDRRQGFIDSQTAQFNEIQRIQQLQARAFATANDATNKNNFDQADQLLQAAEKRSQALLEQADSRLKDARTSDEQQAAIVQIGLAENNVKNILEQRIGLRAQEAALAQTQAAAAQQELNLRRKQFEDAKALIAEINKFEVIEKNASESFANRQAAGKAIVPLTKQLEEVLGRGDINLEQFLGIQNLTRQIRADFTSAVTGQPVKLTFAVEEGIDAIFKKLEARSVKLKAVITDLETASGAKFNLKVGFDDIAIGLVNKMAEISKALEAQSVLPQQKANLATDKQDVTGILSKLAIDKNVGKGLQDTIVQLPSLLDEALRGVEGSQDRLTKVLQQFQTDAAVAQKQAGASGTEPDVQKQFTETARLLFSLVAQVTKVLEESAQIKATEAAAPKVQQAISDVSNNGIKAALTTFSLQQEGVLAKSTAINDTAADLGNKVKQGVDISIPQFDRIRTQVDETAGRFDGLAEKAQDLLFGSLLGPNGLISRPVNDIKGLFGFSQGGAVRGFATGGAAKGTDTIPAALSPDEFVVNARSSRQFFSQLQSINAGHSPSFEPASVTNHTTVGDIIVNGSQQPKQVAREVMAAIRREQRRHASRSL